MVRNGYGFGVLPRQSNEWLWLIQHRMTAKLSNCRHVRCGEAHVRRGDALPDAHDPELQIAPG